MTHPSDKEMWDRFMETELTPAHVIISIMKDNKEKRTMYACNRINSIKAIRAYIRSIMEPMIDDAPVEGNVIQSYTKDSYAEHIRQVTGLKEINVLVDSFTDEFTPTCNNCKVVRRWFVEANGCEEQLTLTADGAIRNHYGVEVSRMDKIAMEAILSVIREKESIISDASEVEF